MLPTTEFRDFIGKEIKEIYQRDDDEIIIECTDDTCIKVTFWHQYDEAGVSIASYDVIENNSCPDDVIEIVSTV